MDWVSKLAVSLGRPLVWNLSDKIEYEPSCAVRTRPASSHKTTEPEVGIGPLAILNRERMSDSWDFAGELGLSAYRPTKY